MAYFFSSAEVFWREFFPFFIVYSGICAFIECHFLLQFMEVTTEKWRYYTAFILINYVAAAICIEIQAIGLVQRIVNFAMLTAFTYVVGAIQKRQNLSNSLTMSILVIAVLNLSEGISVPISHLLINFGAFTNFYTFMVTNVLFSVFLLLLIYFVFYLINRYFIVKSPRGQPYLFVLFIPLTLLILASQSVFDAGYGQTLTVENGVAVSFFNNYHIIFISILAFICLFTILFSLKKLTEQVLAQEQKIVLEQQLEAQEAYTREAGRRYELTRSFRHDLNNHLLVLKELLENNQSEKATEYLQHFDREAGALTYASQTGNLAVDALLCDKLALAQRSGIRICMDVDIPANTALNDFDLCVIFANAIDNAVTACDLVENGKKWIDIKGKAQREFLLLDFMNSYNKGEKSKKGTGIGLSNIESVCKKYSGTMHVEKTEDSFVLTVMLSTMPLTL